MAEILEVPVAFFFEGLERSKARLRLAGNAISKNKSCPKLQRQVKHIQGGQAPATIVEVNLPPPSRRGDYYFDARIGLMSHLETF